MASVDSQEVTYYDNANVQITKNHFSGLLPDQFDCLRRGSAPLNVTFLRWQDSTIGSYVEFVLRVTY